MSSRPDTLSLIDSFTRGAKLVAILLVPTSRITHLQQPDIVSYCQSHGIALEAYSPLVQGSKAKDSVLTRLAEETGKSWAQVLIRWSLQRG